jgi:hypothetical protein
VSAVSGGAVEGDEVGAEGAVKGRVLGFLFGQVERDGVGDAVARVVVEDLGVDPYELFEGVFSRRVGSRGERIEDGGGPEGLALRVVASVEGEHVHAARVSVGWVSSQGVVDLGAAGCGHKQLVEHDVGLPVGVEVGKACKPRDVGGLGAILVGQVACPDEVPVGGVAELDVVGD